MIWSIVTTDSDYILTIVSYNPLNTNQKRMSNTIQQWDEANVSPFGILLKSWRPGPDNFSKPQIETWSGVTWDDWSRWRAYGWDGLPWVKTTNQKHTHTYHTYNIQSIYVYIYIQYIYISLVNCCTLAGDLRGSLDFNMPPFFQNIPRSSAVGRVLGLLAFPREWRGWLWDGDGESLDINHGLRYPNTRPGKLTVCYWKWPFTAV